MNGTARVRAAAAGLLLLAGLAHGGALRGGFIWDDDDYVVENDTLRSADGLRRIWLDPTATPQYYPLVHTSYWLEYRLFGLAPAGYHATNVALHALAALLLWRVLAGLAVPGAWLAAALFAVHPVHVESVAWITERKNTLSAVFYLGAALAALGFALRGAWERRRYALAFGLYLCALLSKTVTASLPAALLLALWWKRGRIAPRDAASLLPFLAVGIPLGLHTAWLERHQVGAIGEEFWGHSPLERCLVAGRALWFYAAKLVWPREQSFVYPRFAVDAGETWHYVPVGAAVSVALLLWLARGRIGRGPLAAVLFFAGTLVPALGFFDVAPMRFSWVADHFQYLASAGLLALAAAAGVGGARALGPRGVRAGRVAAASLLAIFVTLSYQRTLVFRDLETLWRDTLRVNPDGWMPQLNLGHELESQGRREEAVHHYRRALEIRPGWVRANVNLGAALAGLGRYDEAERHLREALQVWAQNPEAHFNLANVQKATRRGREALHHYREALRIDPDHAGAHTNLGSMLLQRGRIAEALVHLEAAARLEPGSARARANLAAARAAAARSAE